MVEAGYIAEKRNPILLVKFMKEPKVIIKTFTDNEIKRMINIYSNNNYLNASNKLIIGCHKYGGGVVVGELNFVPEYGVVSIYFQLCYA